MSLKLKALTATLGAAALAVAAAPSALASPHSPRPITDQVFAPFNVALNHGNVYVADGGTASIARVLATGQLKTLATGPQGGTGDVAGIDLDRSGKQLAYTWTDYVNAKSGLTVLTGGKATMTADLSTYEATHNPDQRLTYGLGKSANQCAQDAIENLSGGPATYTGMVDSHPYAVASLGGGAWVVADAGGNDLLKVTKSGTISTLAVLPRQPLKLTKSVASTLGLEKCVVGLTYNFESVPTDVEVDQHGMLWVSTLPGGPEDPSLGARGSVYKVNPRTGKATRMATGFAGATNLAVAPNGTVYVTELFGGKVSMVTKKGPKTVAEVPGALSVEVKGSWLYVGTMAPMDDQGNPTGSGTIVKIRR
ncbi:MAG TPA: ScyD/ScyE family protein [Segeticoccus sp.]|uniref:ScyD/ScyE family protein n=1 Tax=Segeticoccus sp. TaxID=2706531 RepID=UPI002D7F43F2|nr:ScyD/ScyE family protein [Segeticoccus sp.]HET8601794.1 ScyD/ScyE family protein [Segeticoccus sp.]